MYDRYTEPQMMCDETKIKCLVKECIYNTNNMCRKTEIIIKEEDEYGYPICSSYEFI